MQLPRSYTLTLTSIIINQDCLRTAMTYLPRCYEDLMVKTGCCSLRCRAAFQRVGLMDEWLIN
jgi:hypothetical protein